MIVRRLIRFILAVALVTAVALPAGVAQAAAVLEAHTFMDDFEDLDSQYWTVDKYGGTYVGPALGRLEVLIPADVKGDPFWGAVGSRTGFSIKPDSLFKMSVKYSCLTWPTPDNGIRLCLGVTVYNKKGKPIITLQAGRLSDPDTGESFMVNRNGKLTYLKTKRKSGSFEIMRSIGGFYIRAGSLEEFYSPKIQYVGKIVWGLSVWGHDWKFKGEKVRAGFDDFYVWSEKGFNLPK
jgi:hypothetical protein